MARGVGSSASAPNLPTHVQRNRLTPRSAEACRRTGIEPSELLPLPREAFREVGQSEDVEKLRWEKYETMRVDAYQAVRAERERILAETDGKPFVSDATLAGGAPSSSTLGASRSSLQLNNESNSAGAALEARVLEKIKKKQQAEIEQMVSAAPSANDSPGACDSCHG